MKTKYFKKIEFKGISIEINSTLITKEIGLKSNEIENEKIHVTENYIIIEYEKKSPPPSASGWLGK